MKNLRWEKHVNTIYLKLRRANGALAKLRNYVSLNILTTVYYSLFHSHMFYGCQVWGKIKIMSLVESLFFKKELLELCLSNLVKLTRILFSINITS